MAKLRQRETPVPARGPDVSVNGTRHPSVGDPRRALLVELLPAMTYRLMTGSAADVRLKGWVRIELGELTPDVAWQAHGDRLTAEAAAHDFQPFWLTKKHPHGAGFDAWEAECFKRYRY
jgi:hypothetical protein